MAHEAGSDRILILGGGPGGCALIDMLDSDPHCELVGIVDTNPDANGIQMGKSRGIPVFLNLNEAMQHSKDCTVFNMTNNKSLSAQLAEQYGVNSIVDGKEAKIFWRIIKKFHDTQEDLKNSQSRIFAVINNVREGIISIDPHGVIDNANPAVELVFGYRPEELIGNNISMLMPETDRKQHDGHLERYHRTRKKYFIGNYREVMGMHKNGTTFPLEINVAEMAFNESTHFVAITRDITERKAIEQKLNQLAMYDQLTGLANRTLFHAEFEFLLRQAKRSKTMVALLFIDLDGFKAVNDSKGHQFGDILLQETATRLNDCVRDSDVVARIGGDEFTICLNQLNNPDEAILVAQKIITSLNNPFMLNGYACHIGASIGIAISPLHAKESDNLLSIADEAMYQAKAAGKNNYCMAEL